MTVLTSTHSLAAHVTQQQTSSTATGTSTVILEPIKPRNVEESETVNALRRFLYPFIAGGTPTVVAFQRLCGIRTTAKSDDTQTAGGNAVSYTVTYPMLHAYFRMCSAFGDELFYIVCLPLLEWLYDVSITRRLVFVWFITYIVGQSVKDTLMLPRPPSPPVARIESHYSAEYGMPSTHAMGSFTLPFYLLITTQFNDTAAFAAVFILCAVWCASISLSRLYAGVHCLADIVGGLILGVVCLTVGVLYDDVVEAVITRHPSALSLIVVTGLLIVMAYPTTQHWTNAKGDTAIIIGVTAGVFIASNQLYFAQFPALAENGTCALSVSACITSGLLRFVIGSAVLFATRFVCKASLMDMIAPVLLTPAQLKAQVDPWKCYTTEIPVRVLTYGMIGFNAVFTVPYLFHYIGI